MKSTRIIMGMPITVEILEPKSGQLFEKIFAYFAAIDERFSTYKPTSEISRLNGQKISLNEISPEMTEVLKLAAETKHETSGFFDIKKPDGQLDPSGLVKGWAIWQATKILDRAGAKNYYVEAGGDIQVRGRNAQGRKWQIGIRNPFSPKEIIKIVGLESEGIATSGRYERGDHIYNPKNPAEKLDQVASITVIGPNIYEADRFATAAFAMGAYGINFINSRPNLAGYQIDSGGQATFTSNFEQYVELD